MGFATDKHSVRAQGGTERMKYGLQQRLDPALLDHFQIFVSRVEEPLDRTKIRIYWAHDLAADPATEFLANGGWQQFSLLVFVSNWQMQEFQLKYNIPPSKCVVMLNAIEPIQLHTKPTDRITIGYWSTPHRGLGLLYHAFDYLSKKYDNLNLEVFSSFNLYGWPERDAEFQQLFDACKAHPKITYHGAIPNDVLRERMKNIHIMALPSVWKETSCISLMEAMSAGMLAVHSNYGALYETAANWTYMYQYHEVPEKHLHTFTAYLDQAISDLRTEQVQARLAAQKMYADSFYNWDLRASQWKILLESLVAHHKAPKQMFSYNTQG